MWEQLGSDILEAVVNELLERGASWWERKGSNHQGMERFFGPRDLPLVERWAYNNVEESVELLCALRSVCRSWRRSLTYRLVQVMPYSFESGFITRFSDLGCIEFAQTSELPVELRALSSLRSLRIGSYTATRLPFWFAELPLVSLCIRVDGSHRDAFCVHFSEHMELPPTVRRLEVFAPSRRPDARGLALQRYSRQLVSLRTEGKHFDGNYSWLASSTIAHLSIMHPDISPLVEALKCSNVQSLSLYQEDDVACCGAMQQLSSYLRSEAARASLTELDISGFGFPSAMRGLRLTRLAVSMCFCDDSVELQALPEWIGEMPLVELEVSSAAMLRALPKSLCGLRTLRFLDVSNTYLTRSFDADSAQYEMDLPYDEPLSPMGAARVVDQVFMPLLEANPQLVLRLMMSTFSRNFIERELEEPRGWYRNIPGLIRGATMGTRALLAELAAEKLGNDATL